MDFYLYWISTSNWFLIPSTSPLVNRACSCKLPGVRASPLAPELLEQLNGDIGTLILPISTGGQINGIGRSIKEHVPDCHLIGTEPIGSTILQTHEGSYYNAGSGLDYAPLPVEHVLADGLIDERWAVPDDASIAVRCLLFVGCETGWGVLQPRLRVYLKLVNHSRDFWRIIRSTY